MAINLAERTGLPKTKDIIILKFFKKKVGFIWKFQKNAVPLHPHSRKSFSFLLIFSDKSRKNQEKTSYLNFYY